MKGLKLLIVDHDVHFVDLVITQLKKDSIAVSWVVDGSNVMARIESFSPDVVILNATAPGMASIDTLHRIKADYPLIEVIMLVENNGAEIAILGMQRGAVDYLKKPVSTNDLIRKIKIAYHKKQKHAEKISRFKQFLP